MQIITPLRCKDSVKPGEDPAVDEERHAAARSASAACMSATWLAPKNALIRPGAKSAGAIAAVSEVALDTVQAGQKLHLTAHGG
jgi:hypothetical protein